MCIAPIRNSEHVKLIATLTGEINKDFQKSRDKSTMSDTSFGLKENDNIKVAPITKNVDDMVSATENVLDAALENFNEWYDDICQNGVPIKNDIFEPIKNDVEVRSNLTQSPKQLENIQEEEVKSQKEKCCVQFGSKRPRRFLVLLFLSITFCLTSDVGTEYSPRTFPNNPSVQVRPSSNMFELKAPQKVGVLSILKGIVPSGDGSCFVGIEC